MMAKAKETTTKTTKNSNVNINQAGNNPLYAFGIFGAAFYYIQLADTFGEALIGLLKAFVWPGFLVYEALKFLGA